ncbi:MAG: bifunctional oligoribonuclease/PAP phosphatase NrnA [Clostridiales bacterium]|nr:bifunctional oligoribonuclease/PAP phosphatase NrnA [Clostridiales bacterium]
MKNNASLKEIGSILLEAKSIVIFPHLNPDGDALGSAISLCLALRQRGKDSVVLMEEKVPHYIDFVDKECCTQNADAINAPDVCVCVDCSEETRFPARASVFNKGKTRICIDHHATSEGLGDYYYIDDEEAATAQIIYKMLKASDVEITRSIAEHLYVGLVTDTGCFQYSNTTPETHMIAAQLLEADIDHMGIMVKLYQNIRWDRIEIERRFLNTVELVADGKGAVGYVSAEMLKEAGASLEDADNMVDILRNIEGVEIAGFLKEKGDVVKASLRAKSYGRVDEIAMTFGGGGHVKAAGCTLNMPLADAVEKLKTEIIKNLEG